MKIVENMGDSIIMIKHLLYLILSSFMNPVYIL